MKQNRIMSLIGLCTKAGKIVSGEFMTEKSIKSGKACLVIVAEDASSNTKKDFHDMCQFNKVPYYEYGKKEDLGHAMGKEQRASLAITDSGFSDSLKSYLEESQQ